MSSIGDILGQKKADDLRRQFGAPSTAKGSPSAALRMHAVAAASGLEGCPLKRDSNGRLRARGKFVSVK